MVVTIVSVATTAPLTAAATASPLAMAFWRNCLGFAVLGPLLLLLRRREVVRVVRGERALLRREQWRPLVFGFLAATALALHFAAFMTSTRLTTVAMSTALVATQPVWQALIAAGQGARTSRRTWAGLTLSVVGATAAAGLDIRTGGTALLGDLLALVGAVAQAGYTALSEKSRADVSTPLYSTFTSLVCGLELLLVCWLADIPLTGFDSATHWSLLGLLVLPQLLGLGALNFALGRASATSMSVLLLLETPVAALIAWWLMGQHIELATLPGLLLIIVGVTVVLTSGGTEQAAGRQGAYPDHPYPYPQPTPGATAGATAGAGPGGAAVPPGPYGVGVPPYPGHAPHTPPLPAEAARRDPRVDWAAYQESPTVRFTYHGAGAFDTVHLRRPHFEAGEGERDRERERERAPGRDPVRTPVQARETTPEDGTEY
ncbi:DMT family transporter [Streptomyces liangshanensis]|uniref:DMT family transporter n=2 Tax=Streptomyces liangshanensis TaxID=2717324 RepID=A0A6G9H8R7_9ACTN|nr:DMT family transporter [Streptomyces liangshanensis]